MDFKEQQFTSEQSDKCNEFILGTLCDLITDISVNNHIWLTIHSASLFSRLPFVLRI